MQAEARGAEASRARRLGAAVALEVGAPDEETDAGEQRGRADRHQGDAGAAGVEQAVALVEAGIVDRLDSPLGDRPEQGTGDQEQAAGRERDAAADEPSFPQLASRPRGLDARDGEVRAFDRGLRTSLVGRGQPGGEDEPLGRTPGERAGARVQLDAVR